MLYTPSHAELAQHPKTRKLARMLGVSIPTALGHLHLLWHFALKYAQDGDLARFEWDDIEAGVMWEGTPDQFITNCIAVGWLDVNDPANEDDFGVRVHDWEEHGGKLVNRKEANAARMRETRAKQPAHTKEPRAMHVQRTTAARVEPEETRREETRDIPSAGGRGVRGDDGAAAPTPPNVRQIRAERETRIPDDFPLTQAMRDWAREKVPRLDLEYAHEEFCTYWRSVKTKRLDWCQTWRNGMLKARAREPSGQQHRKTAADFNSARESARTGRPAL